MSLPSQIEVGLSSPPDRETLVADLLVGHEQLAEIRLDGERFLVELYAKRGGLAWQVEAAQLIAALGDAIKLLNDRCE